MKKYLVLSAIGLLLGLPAFAQETGSISGKATMDDGTDLPGVTITATSELLPQSRIAVSSATGEYRFILLPPGD